MQDNRKSITVSTLNSYINGVFHMEDMLQDILVEGEVSGQSLRGNVLYFTLKDNSAQIQAICFGSQKTYVPQNGESVIVRGSVEFYPTTGKTNFNVYSITPKGQGNNFLMLQQLKQKLNDKGYFLSESKKKLPFFIYKICIITSVSGAAIQDILRTMLVDELCFDITVVDSRVQGTDSSRTITNALKIADEQNFDVIIIARGGGSAEDLASFNDELLLDAVHEAKTPIISAVGHEIDYTLIDFVADVRALTPTDAGKIIVENNINNISLLAKLKKELSGILQFKYLELKSKVSELNFALQRAIENYITKNTQKLSELKTILQTLNPQNLLKIGYTLVEKDGKKVTLKSQIAVGDELVLHFADGMIKTIVKE